MNKHPPLTGKQRLLLGVLLAAVFATAAYLSLKFADVRWVVTVVEGAAGLAVLAMAVRAVADRGRGQVFAIGFIVCALLYWLVRWSGVPYFGDNFGTDLLTSRLHILVSKPVWIDRTTGQTFDYDPATKPPSDAAASGRTALRSSSREFAAGSGAEVPTSAGPMTPPVTYDRIRVPLVDNFQAVAHCHWTILFGLAAGGYARLLYLRHNERPTDEALKRG